MRLQTIAQGLRADGIGVDIYALAAEMFPICRSITGNGVRQTLSIMSRYIDIEQAEVPTGTEVLDWTVPREWNITDAYIKDGDGNRIVDFRKSNLHVMSYSVPVRATLPLTELRQHLHSLPDRPDVVPYRTSYYAENWGFCLAHRTLQSMQDESYEVMIDSTLSHGSLTYGEYLHKGQIDDEFLLSAHICHPSLANDNCSALAVLAHLAKRMSGVRTKYSYRFIFAPGTIGAITWLARNQHRADKIKHGLVVSMLGDGGGPTYKRSRSGKTMIDRAAIHALQHSGLPGKVVDFSPYGYDERQYCSPGFNLPVGLLQRSQFGTIPEYHTSADNLEFITPEHLEESYHLISRIIGIVEDDCVYWNTKPYGEPQLGKRGLYHLIGGDKDSAERNMAMLWVLNMSDGSHSLLDIAERAVIPFETLLETAKLLEQQGLLQTMAA